MGRNLGHSILQGILLDAFETANLMSVPVGAAICLPTYLSRSCLGSLNHECFHVASPALHIKLYTPALTSAG